MAISISVSGATREHNDGLLWLHGEVSMVVDRRWVDLPVEMTIDVKRLIAILGNKAKFTKSRKSTAVEGAITVTVQRPQPQVSPDRPDMRDYLIECQALSGITDDSFTDQKPLP